MASPSESKETNICLDDIRLKLNKIEDTELALDILNNLENLSNQLADKSAVIAEKIAREQSLIQINNQLFAKVNAAIDKQPPDTTVDYNDIDRNLHNIIDKF